MQCNFWCLAHTSRIEEMEAGSKPYTGIIIKIPAQLQALTAIPNISQSFTSFTKWGQ